MPTLEYKVVAVTNESTRALEKVERQARETAAAAGKIDDSMRRMGTAAPQHVRPLQESLRTSSMHVEDFALKIQGLVTAFAGLYVVQRATQAIREFARAAQEAVLETIRYGDDLQTLADQTGVNVRTLSELRYAADQLDASFGEVANGIKYLQRNTADFLDGIGEAVDAFDKLGVSAKEVEGLSTWDALLLIADRFRNLKTEADRTQVAMDIFGRSGIAMVPVLDAGAQGLERYAERARELGRSLSPAAAQAAGDADNAIKNLKESVRGLRDEAISPLLPDLTSLLNSLTEIAVVARTGELDKILAPKADDSGLKTLAKSFAALGAAFYKHIGEEATMAWEDFKTVLDAVGTGVDEAGDDLETLINWLRGVETQTEAATESMNRYVRAQDKIKAPETAKAPPEAAPGLGTGALQRVQREWWEESIQRDIERESRRESERLDAEERERIRRQQEAQEFEAWWRANILGDDPLKNNQKAQAELSETLTEQVDVVESLDDAFDDLARVAELVESRTLGAIAALASFVIELIQLIQTLEGGLGGAGGFGAFGGIARLFGIGGGPGKGDAAAKTLEAPAARLDSSAVELSKSARELTNAAKKQVSASDIIIQAGPGVAPLGPSRLDIPTGGAAAAGRNLLGMAGYAAIGIPAVVGFGQLLGGLLSQRNQEYRTNLEKFRQEFWRQQVEGGPWLTRIAARGGYVESWWEDRNRAQLGPPRPPEGVGYGDPQQVIWPEEDAGKASAAGVNVTVNVQSVSPNSSRDYFSSGEFRQAMDWARNVKALE